ncbi:hypothetical protein D3C77_561940 [compost metagenome]
MLAEVRVKHIVDNGLQVAVRHHWHYRAELFFLIYTHLRTDRVEQGRVEERAAADTAAFVEHASALFQRVGNQAIEVVDLARFGEWRQAYPRLPGHAGLEGSQLALEFVEKAAYHVFMHEKDFQGRAALAVERQGPCDRFVDGVIQINLGQHDPRVFRIQAQSRA